MGFKRSGWALVEFCLAWTLMLGAAGYAAVDGETAQAQSAPAIATTQVTDTVYRANGTAASGTVLVSWPAFSTAAGDSVPAGSTSVTIGAGGALSVALVANAGSTPVGSYYTVVYHLDDGSVTREYWVVPVSAGAVQVSAIRSSVLPTSVAMQTVSKSYVDTAIAAAVSGHPLDSSPYVLKSGDTMSGPLTLAGDPTAPLQASDKQYVDNQVTGLTSGLSQKVSLLPQSTQTVAQPTGTQLDVNKLNGAEYASQYLSGGGNNGIANAITSPDCAGGCEVVAEQSYASPERVSPTSLNNETRVDDHRGGATYESIFNPMSVQTPGLNTGRTIDLASSQATQDVHAATGASNVTSITMEVKNEALAGGSNVYPDLLQGSVPYFKTTYGALSLAGTSNTIGQHVLVPEVQNCYGVGDCLMGGMYMQASGGFRDDADEGSHPFDLLFSEDTKVFGGTCASGCATGSTNLQVTATASPGTQGEGRYLMDKNPADVIATGVLTSGTSAGRQPSASFSGTNFPVSTFLETAQTIPTQANSINPGTVTVPIVTGGVPAGFATNTAALPANSGVACISDVQETDGRPLNFETAAYTVIDGTHLQMTLNRPHGTGATVAVGGLCGYGIEQTVDTVGIIRQVFPVIGSTSANSLVYAGGQTPIVGVQGLQSAFTNVNLVVASIARASNVVTVTTAGNLPVDLNGLTLTVQGVTDTSYNGSFAVTTTGPNTLTYAENGADSTSAGGTLSVLTGGYALYPMAEVLNVYNASTKAIDGQMTLAANTVPWATGDAVEEPHYFQEAVSADLEQITQFVPRPSRNSSAGILYLGNVGPGLQGWQIINGVSPNAYFGNGGTHTAPTSGIDVQGVWQHSMELEAGEQAAIQVHCNSHGCDKWNSTYALMQMDTSAGQDGMYYSPATSAWTLALRGTQYGFNPTGMTAGTINVGTLNAGTIHGTVSGTVTASSLPVFGASGSGHAPGAVPDPGATAGTTKFLREDGQWVAAGASTQVVSTSGFTTNGPANFPQRANLLGEYLFAEGTGTVAHDTSGQGNDATINGPTWEGTADLNFQFGQSVQLPTALNAGRTFMFAMYQTALAGPLSLPGAFATYPSILCGTDNLHLCMLSSSVDSVQSQRFDVVSSNDHTESGEALTPGWHIVTFICGSNVGGVVSKTHILFDGAEVGNYLRQGDVQTCNYLSTAAGSGNYELGGFSAGNPFSYYVGLLGKVAATWVWGSQLSLADAAAASQSAWSYIQTKGVQTTFRKSITPGPQILAGLDSRTAGYGLVTPNVPTPSAGWPAQMALTDSSYTVSNLAVVGQLAFDACVQFDQTYGMQMGTGSGPVITVLWGGVNDDKGQTPRQVADSLRCMVQKAKADGSRVVVATEISSYSNAGTAGDNFKNGLNPIIRAEAFGWGADNIADLATDAHFGADGASANTTCYQDTVHPTAACEPYVTAIMQDAVNELIGSSATNWHQTAAATYQELAGDGYLNLTGTAAQTVTLPSCTGYSLPRQIVNLGSAAGTVGAVSGQTLSGSTTLAVGARATFVPVPGALTTGGCSWERTQ